MTGFERKRTLCWLALALLGFACRQGESEATPAHTVTPAPVEPAPAEPVAPAEAVTPKAAEPTPAAAAPAQPAPAAEPPVAAAPRPSASKPSANQTAKPRASAKAATPARTPEPEPAPSPSAPVDPPAPEPAVTPAAPIAKPATRVVVPNTERVRVDVPAGLQGWLDKDPRMQPWLGKVMKVIDACYADVLADNPSATGTISFRITMHANARPDPDIQSLPGQLSGVVACATGQLMRARMPLFTGTEGEQYVVRVRFGS